MRSHGKTVSRSKECATSASWPTSMPVRRRRPSASCYYTGVNYKIGEVHEGTATMDWMEQEQERGITITSAATTCFWRDITDQHHRHARPRRLHGRGGALAARARRRGRGVRRRRRRRAAVRDGVAPGRQVQRSAHLLRQQDGPRRAPTSTARVDDDRTTACGANPVPIQLPIGAEDQFKGIIDLVEMKALIWRDETLGAEVRRSRDPGRAAGRGQGVPREDDRSGRRDRRRAAREVLEGETITNDESRRHSARRTIAQKIVPVICGIGVQEQGRAAAARRGRRLPAVAARHPAGARASTPTTETKSSSARPTTRSRSAALVFKIMTDPFVGQLAFFRVYSGHARRRATRCSTRPRAAASASAACCKMHANKREEIEEVLAGDICAAVGLKNVTTGDTICDEKHPVVLEAIDFPEPVIQLAIEPKTKADQEKLGMALSKLAQEDPTFRVHTDPETGQTIICRHGRAAPRDHRRPPDARVQRRRQRRQAAGRLPRDDHRRQARGGRALRPPDRRPRPVRPRQDPHRAAPPEADFVFDNEIVGGTCRRNSSSRPSRASRKRWSGPLAGYPMTGIKVDALRRQLPRRRLLRNRLQDRRLDGLPGRLQARPGRFIMEPIMAVEA